jgi:hypothetical protein
MVLRFGAAGVFRTRGLFSAVASLAPLAVPICSLTGQRGDGHAVAEARVLHVVRSQSAAAFELGEEMLTAVGVSKEQLVAESPQFYRTVTVNEKIPWRDRLRARECVDSLLGLKGPVPGEITAW